MKLVLQTIQSKIKAEILSQVGLGSGPLVGIKKVFLGDPIQIPEVDLPSIVVHPIGGPYVPRGTRYDQKTHKFEVRIIENKKTYFNKTNPSQDTVDVVIGMIDKAETVTNGETMGTSICGIIQKNKCLNTDLGSKVADDIQIDNVSYSFNEKRGFPTYEAVVVVNAIVIGNR